MAEHTDYIELNREFRELSSYAGKSDDVDISQVFGVGSPLNWDSLLLEYRVIILAEAGTGKTEEIRHITRRQIADGKPAFFLRLEHIKDGLELAFEEGELADFQSWLASDEEGWLFLDSVDEARLGDPKDFERAIRKLGLEITPALQRAHIFITSRTTGWRPYTDLKLCKEKLPYTPDQQKASKDEEGEFEAQQVSDDSDDSDERDTNAPYKIVSLKELSLPQIKTFAEAEGVEDSSDFMDEIERKDAYIFATRPLDLEDLVSFWKAEHRIGSRLELMRFNIDRKLSESDPERAEHQPIAKERIRLGARVVAAAATLSRESTVRVPDAKPTNGGIDVKSILPDWNEQECKALLVRPVFDEAVYGTVRFHHRSVREFLTAEWLSELLESGNSRREIEALCFKEQYEIDVVVPALRPIVPWLALYDAKILDRLTDIAPEVLLEGGDPSALPKPVRQKILRRVCSKIAEGKSAKSVTDYGAAQRFADDDIASDIKELLAKHKGSSDLEWFLLRMVWQGRLSTCLDEAKTLASDASTEHYSRIAAIRAVETVGVDDDLIEVFRKIVADGSDIDHSLIAEFLQGLPATDENVDLALEALEKSAPYKRFSVTGLDDALDVFIERLSIEQVERLVAGISALLRQTPVVERRHCELSKKFAWLIIPGALAVERLVKAKHPSALIEPSLDILSKLPSARDYADIGRSEVKTELPSLVPAWDELNYTLFWYEVAQKRSYLDKKTDQPLDDWYRVRVFGSYWHFGEQHFDQIKADAIDKALEDDRKVALTLAFDIYRDCKRPRRWREQLKKAVAHDPALKALLDGRLKPPAQSDAMKRMKQQDQYWKRKHAARDRAEEKRHADWRSWMKSHIPEIRGEGLKLGVVYNHHQYLHERLSDLAPDNSHWTQSNWKDLEADQSTEIAGAYRDWSMDHWRNYQPKLRSEGIDRPNSIPGEIIFGLSGLQIETGYREDWISELTDDEIELATRYAIYEMNGFPAWFDELYQKRREIVRSVLLTEVEWEMQQTLGDQERLYVLHDLAYRSREIRSDLASEVLALAAKYEPGTAETLQYMQRFILDSDLGDEEIAKIAKARCQAKPATKFLAHWLSIWVSTEPEPAIKFLKAHLKKLKKAKATEFAMHFVGFLLGRHRSLGVQRERFKEPEHLKTLFLLMHEHIRQEEDINRANGGVYSPGPRDDAQDGRNELFSLINQQPGKEAFLALKEISELHPNAGSRAWISTLMRNRAAADAEISAWSIDDVLQFGKSLEKCPTNNRELYELAVWRLLDLQQELEHGDSSIASVLRKETQEIEVRKYIGQWLRDRSAGAYAASQEEEMADAKRPDFRFLSSKSDGPVPAELKLADNWTGTKLFERLENQLCRDYLRDRHSRYGIFALVYRGKKKSWQLPDGSRVAFAGLVDALSHHWTTLFPDYPEIDDVKVTGIDLTKRDAP